MQDPGRAGPVQTPFRLLIWKPRVWVPFLTVDGFGFGEPYAGLLGSASQLSAGRQSPRPGTDCWQLSHASCCDLLRLSLTIRAAGQELFPECSKIRGSEDTAKLGFLHTVMGMDLYLCLSGVHFPFFSNSPLKHPFRKCCSPRPTHAQALVRAEHTPSCHLLLLLELESVPS